MCNVILYEMCGPEYCIQLCMMDEWVYVDMHLSEKNTDWWLVDSSIQQGRQMKLSVCICVAVAVQ